MTNTYKYFKTDHLGNVRVLLAVDGYSYDEQQTLIAEQNTDYYPFGLAHGQYENLHLNRFLFSGKELQDAPAGAHGMLGWYDFGFRQYNPLLGHWMTPDPAKQVANPYLFCGNAPIVFVDKTGLTFTFNWATGEYLDDDGNPIPWHTVSQWIMGKLNFGLRKVKNTVSSTYDGMNQIATPYLNLMANSSNSIVSITGLMLEFFTGFGEGSRDFYANSPLTQSIMQSNMTKIALDQFYGDYMAGKDTTQPYRIDFLPFGFGDTGPGREWWADGMTAIQFLGTSTYFFEIEKGMLNVRVLDSKTPNSLFYHAIPARYSRETFPIMGQTVQRYHFTIPLNSLPNYINR